MAERSIWKGVLAFGMVSVPVKLFTATSDKDIKFNQLHDKCKGRINQVKICKACNELDLKPADLIKGYEYTKDSYVILSDNDLETLPVLTKKLISVTQFIDANEIDPIQYEKTYYLRPEHVAANKAFGLFVRTLKEKKKAGLAKFTLRTKERLCLVRVKNCQLLVTTLLYPDEISVNLAEEIADPGLSDQELQMGSMLIDMMSKPYSPSEVVDTYRDALIRRIESKLEGKEEVVAAEPAVAKTTNLLDALAATLAAMAGK